MDNSIITASKDLLERLAQDYCAAEDPKQNQCQTFQEEVKNAGLLELVKHTEGQFNLNELIELIKLDGYYHTQSALAMSLATQAWAYQHSLDLPVDFITVATEHIHEDEKRIQINKVLQSQAAKYVIISTSQSCYLAKTDEADILFQYEGELFSALSWSKSKVQKIEVSEEQKSHLKKLASLFLLASSVGAMEKTVEMTLDYAGTRKQFTRPLGKFQAIQQQLSLVAEHLTACQMALQLAASSPETEALNINPQRLACAYIQIQNVSWEIADTAHGVHGAIGISQEYALQYFSRKLREYIGYFGHQSQWQEALGRYVLDQSEQHFFEILISI